MSISTMVNAKEINKILTPTSSFNSSDLKMSADSWKQMHTRDSSECVLAVSFCSLTLLQVAELQEMGGPMILMIVLPRCSQLHSILHARSMLYSHEIVIPWSIIRDLKIRMVKSNIKYNKGYKVMATDNFVTPNNTWWLACPYHVETKEAIT